MSLNFSLGLSFSSCFYLLGWPLSHLVWSPQLVSLCLVSLMLFSLQLVSGLSHDDLPWSWLLLTENEVHKRLSIIFSFIVFYTFYIFHSLVCNRIRNVFWFPILRSAVSGGGFGYVPSSKMQKTDLRFYIHLFLK